MKTVQDKFTKMPFNTRSGKLSSHSLKESWRKLLRSFLLALGTRYSKRSNFGEEMLPAVLELEMSDFTEATAVEATKQQH